MACCHAAIAAPNLACEEAIRDFVSRILQSLKPDPFLADLLRSLLAAVLATFVVSI